MGDDEECGTEKEKENVTRDCDCETYNSFCWKKFATERGIQEIRKAISGMIIAVAEIWMFDVHNPDMHHICLYNFKNQSGIY